MAERCPKCGALLIRVGNLFYCPNNHLIRDEKVEEEKDKKREYIG